MALFPLFINLEEKNVLIIGGGKVALRKIEKLLPFNPNLKVISKEFLKETEYLLKENNIPFEKRSFTFEDLKNIDIVIVAVDDIKLQKEIFQFTRGKNILVNAVDSPAYCDFIFPSYVKKGDLVIGITTSGKAPGLSAKIRQLIEKSLPENIEEILQKISSFRESLPKGEKRQKETLRFIEEIFKKLPPKGQ
ncbi:MAG: bifunctional precorrin-2 dehydrogenase/sirohydrochlorin ferrochelatase [Aquificae bacterium]|nr:bifunctional precorrin-2 dehydrogenase/sirohydrochlorin ferrochelatase [Aquificota bacterium]